MKNWIIAGLVAIIAIGGAVVFAQSSHTANVEVRVWEDVNDTERHFISARPEGGSWRTLGTIPLPLTDGVSNSGRFRYGDITLAVPLPGEPALSATECADRYRAFRDAHFSLGASGAGGGWGAFVSNLPRYAGIKVESGDWLSLLAMPAVQAELRRQAVEKQGWPDLAEFLSAAASLGEACVSRFRCWSSRGSGSIANPPAALRVCVAPGVPE